MNVKKPDYIGLVREIETAKGRDFTPKQVSAIIDELKTIEWRDAYRLTVYITRQSNLPSNVYGMVLNRIDEVKHEKAKLFEQREYWKPATEDCASSEEFTLTMACISKISRFVDAKKRLKNFGHAMEKEIENNNLLTFLKKVYDKLMAFDKKCDALCI